MFRILFTLYLAATLAIGPRVCCFSCRLVESGTAVANHFLAATTLRTCCHSQQDETQPAGPCKDCDKSGNCHNIPREVIVGTNPVTDVPAAPFVMFNSSDRPSVVAMDYQLSTDRLVLWRATGTLLALLQILRC